MIMDTDTLISVRDHMTIRIVSFSHPDSRHAADHWWLDAEYEVSDRTSRTCFSGAYVQTVELASLESQLERLLDAEHNEAALQPLEKFYDIVFRRTDRLGHFKMEFRLDSLPLTGDADYSRHTYVFAIDQTDIRLLISQLRRVLKEFPVTR